MSATEERAACLLGALTAWNAHELKTMQDPKLRESFDFYKANVQDPTLYWYVQGAFVAPSWCWRSAGPHEYVSSFLAAESSFYVMSEFCDVCPAALKTHQEGCRKVGHLPGFWLQQPLFLLMWVRWIKRNNVTSIPYFLVYNPQGNQILATTASFKRMPIIKEGMYTIQQNPQVSTMRVEWSGRT